MKKSFKKAGAAVLSMAMLLSMGAVSLPVYAENNIKPGQVEVSISNNAWADDDKHEYEYLDSLVNVDSATVSLYKVAELGTNGWEWNNTIKTELAKSDYAALKAIAEDADGNDLDPALNLTLFEDLLKKVQDDDGNDTDAPLASSQDLMSLASALERIVINNSVAAIANGTITNGGTVTLPGDPTLTANTIGYYLLVTKADNAGVRVQPSLFVLKNAIDDEDDYYGNNPRQVSVKGVEINVDKRVATVVDKDSSTSTGGTVVSASGDTAVVAKNDIIQYVIEAEVPSYDPLLPAANIKDFKIVDTPDQGLKIYDWNSSTNQADYTEANFKVYISATPLNKDTINTRAQFEAAATAGTIKELSQGTDYTITADPTVSSSSTVTDGKGFTITVTGPQMRANGANKTDETADTMEGEYIYVVFDATVTDQLNRVYHEVEDSKTYGDLAYANINMTAQQLGAKMNADKAGSVADAEDTGATPAEITAFLTAIGSAAPTDVQLAAIIGEETHGQSDDFLKVAAYLKLKEMNAGIAETNATNEALNGNKNKATMTFGNDYATGQGDGKDEDLTKVFSVDLDLDKKVKKELINSAGGSPEDEISYEPVSGAVFKLVKLDESNSDAPLNEYAKYAVSDTNGDLVLIVPDATYKGVALTEEVNFTENGTAKTYHKTSESAWIEVTTGDYKLYEVFAPAGYEKWKDTDALSFNITATQDDVTGEYIGEFSAEAKSGQGQVIMDLSDDNSGVYFQFAGEDGQLDGTVLNKYADKLPATGGIGTVLFTAGGISIVLIAGALFVMYMKKRNAEDEE